MNLDEYWHKKHLYYSDAKWINDPTDFASFVIRFMPPKGTVLELGAGQGQDSRFFAKNNYNVLSTDLSKTALNISKIKAKKEQLKNIDFQILDIGSGSLPFKDCTFDIVYSHLSIHYFDESTTQKIFSEVYRVLKAGGIFAFLANSMTDPDTKNFPKIDQYLYRDPEGLQKRYFTVKYTKKRLSSLFQILVLDDQGTMQDPNKPDNLIRFIGQK